MISDTKQQPKRKRRWLTFSLRTLLVVATVLCAVLGYWTHRANRQKAVVKWVEENGGSVVYDKPHGPEWVQAFLGKDYLAAVTAVDLRSSRLKDVTPLAKLENLEDLVVVNTQVSDLSPLVGLKSLEKLTLVNARVTQEQINELQEALPHCRIFWWPLDKAIERQRAAVKWVEEHGARVTYDFEYDENGYSIKNGRPRGPKWVREFLGDDYLGAVVFADFQYFPVKDVAPLANLKQLKYLELVGSTQVSDVAPLAQLKSLKYLGLDGTRVSDLTPLAGLTSLEQLYLGRTQVSDLTPLMQLTSLDRLSLYSTQVSDLTPLMKLTSLTDLTLYDTQVTQEQVNVLQNALPNCKIFWSPPDKATEGK